MKSVLWAAVAAVFTLFATGVTRVIGFAEEGTRFVFGNAADSSAAWGFIFAVKVLPIIVFFASLMAFFDQAPVLA